MSGAGPSGASLRLEIPATCESLELVHEATVRVATTAGFASDAAGEIAVAVGEAMTNVVVHAYRREEGHDIVVRYAADASGLRIELEHSGEYPDRLPAGIDLAKLVAERRRGGLGVHLMRRLMDRVAHEEVAPGVGCWILERRRREPKDADRKGPDPSP